jgi:hypothetical protein
MIFHCRFAAATADVLMVLLSDTKGKLIKKQKSWLYQEQGLY